MCAESLGQCLAHSRYSVDDSYLHCVLWLSNSPLGFQFYVSRTNWRYNCQLETDRLGPHGVGPRETGHIIGL